MMAQSAGSSASRITYYGYKLFESEQRKRLQQQYPTVSEPSLLKRIGDMWRSMTEAQQMQWGERARSMAYGQQQMAYPNFLYPSAQNDSVQSRVQSSALPQNYSQPVSAATNDFANISTGASNPWAMHPQGSHHGMQRSLQGGNSQMHSISNQQPTTTSLTPYSGSRGSSRGLQPQTQTDQTSTAMQPFSMPTFSGMSHSRVPALPYQPNPPSCMQQQNNNGVVPYSQRSPAAIVQHHQRPQSFGSVNQMMHFGQRFSSPRAPSSSSLMPCRQQFPRTPLNQQAHMNQVSNQRTLTYPSGHGQQHISRSNGSNRLAIQANPASQQTLNMADVFDTTPAPQDQAYKEIVIEVNGVKQTILVPTANDESNSSKTSSKNTQATNSGNTHSSPRAQVRNSGAGHSSSSSVSPRSSIGASVSPSHSSSEIRRAEKRSHHSSSSSSAGATSGSSRHTGSSSTPPGARHAKHSRNASQDEDTLPAAKDDVSKLTAGMSNQVRELLNGMFTKSGSSSKATSASENPKGTIMSQSPDIPKSSPDLPTTSGSTQAPSRDRVTIPDVSLPRTTYGMQSSTNAFANKSAQQQIMDSNMLGTTQAQRQRPNVPPLTNCTTASAVQRTIPSVNNQHERHSGSLASRQPLLSLARPGFGNVPPLRHLPQEKELSQVPAAVPLSMTDAVHPVRKEINTVYPGNFSRENRLSQVPTAVPLSSVTGSVHSVRKEINMVYPGHGIVNGAHSTAELSNRGNAAYSYPEINAVNSKHGMLSNSASSGHRDAMTNSTQGMMTNSIDSYHGLFTSRAHSDFGALSSAIHEPVSHSASSQYSVISSSANMSHGVHSNTSYSNSEAVSHRNYFSNSVPSNHTSVASVGTGVNAASERLQTISTTARAHQGVIQKAASATGALREILKDMRNISNGSVAESWKQPSSGDGVVNNNSITTSKYEEMMLFPGSNDVRIPQSITSGFSHGGVAAEVPAQTSEVITSSVSSLPHVSMLSPAVTTDRNYTNGPYMPPAYNNIATNVNPPRMAANHMMELSDQQKSSETTPQNEDHVSRKNSLNQDSVVISSEKETGAIVLTIRNRPSVESRTVSEKALTPRAKLRPDFQSSSLPGDGASYLTEHQPALPPRTESPSICDLNSANKFVNRVPDVNIPCRNMPQYETKYSSHSQNDATQASKASNLPGNASTSKDETNESALAMDNPIDKLCQVAIQRLDTSLVQTKTVLLSEICDSDLGVSSLYDDNQPGSSGLNQSRCSDDYVPEHDSDSEDEMNWQPAKRKHDKQRKRGKKYRRIMTLSERNSRRIVDSDSETNEEFDWLVSSSSSEEDDEMCSKRKSSRAAAKAAKSAIGQLISLETATTPTKSQSRELLQLQIDYWSMEKRAIAERSNFNEDETKRMFNVKNCCVMLRRLDISELPKRVI